MIRDPYIGMPIIIGGTGGNMGNNSGQQGRPPGGSTGGMGSGQMGSGSMQRPDGGVQRPDSGMQRPDGEVQRPDSDIQRPTGNNFGAMVLDSLPIAISYTPMQQWKTTYSQSEALNTGTVFPELNLPFLGGRKL